jgi:PHD/YefM family antitoxin component YafN of YafNO toxin-antitoxin module
MNREIPIAQARRELSRLPELFAGDPDLGALAVTRRGHPVLALMPWELYDSLIETLEILGDSELVSELRQGILEIDAGKGVAWEDALPDLAG